ncbi:DUF1972 domain-containing protein [Demequina capsici]|uniref:DUF1972 domain-containing protein n=1 Tax=Demequina capsici TaxID=3075620 RepID=A0AA96FE81_9MICO|nr:DUF1972 domain-containing protein [Demequina sp. PMTSA13]WNM27802.1 DUF1972 domain-containing protein [Demequina sp. PMTSA13]
MNVEIERTAPRVAIIGTRGYPSYYGGFETAVRYLVPHLVEQGWQVDVYGRDSTTATHFDGKVVSRRTFGLDSKALSTPSFGFTSCVDAAWRRPDVALVMNVANGFWLPFLRARGIPTVVNVDGIEWERAKWGKVARAVFRSGAKAVARWGDELVFDADAIGDYWRSTFDRDGTFIPYGGPMPGEHQVAPLDLASGKYVLYVARFVPENSILEFMDAVEQLPSGIPVVVVGSSGYGGEIEERVAQVASSRPSVTWLGHVKDDVLLEGLWAHAGVYFHGHSVGGTNPALVQAMWAGAPTLARDTVYNREVLGAGGCFVDPSPNAIASIILELLGDDSRRAAMVASARTRAHERYSWASVVSAYEQLLRKLRDA